MAVHPTWVLETEVLAGLNHPLLLSDAALLRGLSPERREHLRRLLEQGRPPDDHGAGSESL
jgi:hypothetical protein